METFLPRTKVISRRNQSWFQEKRSKNAEVGLH